MATISEVADAIRSLNDGIQTEITDCMESNRNIVLRMISEQLYSGLDGEGNYLNPNYDNDPFFNEKGPWQDRAYAYKAWKNQITPPVASPLLGLPARPTAVPNLFINGKFYSSIVVSMAGDHLHTAVNLEGNSGDILHKWGDVILGLGPTSRTYFVDELLKPHLMNYFKRKGVK